MTTLADQARTDALLNYYQNPDPNDRSGSNLTVSPTTATAFQCSTNRESTLYINVTTAAALTIAMGPTAACAITISASETTALGVVTLIVPTGWWVMLTGTMADLAVTKIKK
jgi:hypothetical protein